MGYGGTIGKSSEIAISLNFTAEHANNAEDRISFKTLRPLHFSAVIKTLGFLDSFGYGEEDKTPPS